MDFDPLAPLPLVTAELPGIGGTIKEFPEDFEVEEIPAYEPSGSGSVSANSVPLTAASEPARRRPDRPRAGGLGAPE